MRRLQRSLKAAAGIWTMGGDLGLQPADKVKYALSYYLSRVVLPAITPSHFVVTLPRFAGRKALLRPNGVDYGTLSDVFLKQLYSCHSEGASSVSRVLDLGANIGLAALFLSHRFPNAQFACVEPSPDNEGVLRETIALNGIRATIFNAAIGTEAGEAVLHLGADPTAYSLSPKGPSERTLKVPQVTVEQLLEQLGWAEIDVLKIDIEGYEKVLFRSNTAWLDRVRFIIGEAHGHVDYGIDEVRHDLEKHGFDVRLQSEDPRWKLIVFTAQRTSSRKDVLA